MKTIWQVKDKFTGDGAPFEEGEWPALDEARAALAARMATTETEELAIKDLAERFWRIHPREIQDLGITRQEFYEREVVQLFNTIGHSRAAQ